MGADEEIGERPGAFSPVSHLPDINNNRRIRQNRAHIESYVSLSISSVVIFTENIPLSILKVFLFLMAKK